MQLQNYFGLIVMCLLPLFLLHNPALLYTVVRQFFAITSPQLCFNVSTFAKMFRKGRHFRTSFVTQLDFKLK